MRRERERERGCARATADARWTSSVSARQSNRGAPDEISSKFKYWRSRFTEMMKREDSEADERGERARRLG